MILTKSGPEHRLRTRQLVFNRVIVKILKDGVGPGAQEILVTYRVKNNETVAVT